MGITFDLTKLKTVPIEEVRPNTWNPKEKGTSEYEHVVASIRLNGQRSPIAVREKDGYEIIDGEQRYLACKELKYTKILIYNEGELNDKEAKASTMWWQVQVPFDFIKEVKLALELSELDIEIPYLDTKLEEFKDLLDFDWSTFEKTELEDAEFATLTFKMQKSQAAIVELALVKAKNEEDSNERALELICAEFLS